MRPWLNRVIELLGRWEQAFLLALLIYLPATWLAPQASLTGALRVVVWFFGLVVAYRLIRAGLRHGLWRLRNRLLIAYVFIAVVPIVLILALATITAWLLTGQLAVHLVSSRLEDRIRAMDSPIAGILSSPPEQRRSRADWVGPYLASLFPEIAVRIQDARGEYVFPPGSAAPSSPDGWKDGSGIVLKDGEYYLWSHHRQDNVQVTAIAPVDGRFLSNLVPGIGDVRLFSGSDVESAAIRIDPSGANRRPGVEVTAGTNTRGGRSPFNGAANTPPKANVLDFLVYNGTVIPVARWAQADTTEQHLMGVRTRPSALLRIAYSQRAEVAGFVLAMLAILAGLFLVVELVSLILGISFTRTITRAVHNLYEGTRRIQQGDFSHRIPVKGKDQLAELTLSFNEMTENMQRLLAVEKEQQRLQSDLEIARKVQSELFPKETPKLRGLDILAQVSAANLVSGDYYDFIKVEGDGLAVAFGDVAGKGISAALLMAAVQSIMRVQVLLLAESNGNPGADLSTAQLVSRLNVQLYNHTSAEKFSTFYFAHYDEESGKLRYTNAGHLPPILIRGGEVIRLDVNGMVVGAFPFAQFGQSSIDLVPGDLLVCFTDGVTEPENEYGEMFGEERLVEIVRNNSSLPPEQLIRAITSSVLEWTGSPQLQDDMTVLVARKL